MTLARMQEQLGRIEGVVEAKSRFSDRAAWWIDGMEIAHFDNENVLDIRLTAPLIRARRQELNEHPEIEFRRSSGADWIEISIQDLASERLALQLVSDAAAAHRGIRDKSKKR